jgi:hypothetical protein
MVANELQHIEFFYCEAGLAEQLAEQTRTEFTVLRGLIMSTDNRVSSSLYENLFGGQLTNRLSETFELLPRLSRASAHRSLHCDFYQHGRVGRLLGFHDLKPSLNGLLNVRKGLLMGFPLRKTAGKCGDFGHVVAGLILFNHYVQFHSVSFFPELRTYFYDTTRKGAKGQG